MTLTAKFKANHLNFKIPGGTSRGVLKNKPTWYLFISDGKNTGIGECSIIPNLSIDKPEAIEEKLTFVCENINNITLINKELVDFPAIQFALETALLDLQNGGDKILFPSNFTNGKDSIEINGLIWMGKEDFMQHQIKEKLSEGFNCIKMKIGAIDFENELAILKQLRSISPQLTIRVDANGAFNINNVYPVLNELKKLNIHSIEQPIKQGNWEDMKALCSNTPIPIALDEELIGINSTENKKTLIKTIQPQYIILKPSLVGGLNSSKEWIAIAEENNVGWWITSALESNIGLNAIAQFTYTLNNKMPQGLGTGKLFTNNINSPLTIIEHGKLIYDINKQWEI